MKQRIFNFYLENEKESFKKILNFIREKKIIYIQNKPNKSDEFIQKINYEGPGLILNSSGSKNKPKKCIHSIQNLDKSAKFSGEWLQKQGFILDELIIYNTLPLNHISGVMSFWRSILWECEFINISPQLIKRTEYLLEKTKANKRLKRKCLITSMVPTQLYRLLSSQNGIKWLQIFDLVWVGGAHINTAVAEICIKEKIKICPCYGATETAAMISALESNDFLKGNKTVGEIFKDINIKINEKGIIEVKGDRIGIELLSNSGLRSFKNENGWWESGDLGELIKTNQSEFLNVLGRSDNAFTSGGITVFPDLIKLKIKKLILKENFPIHNFYISIFKDFEWGKRYEVILYFQKDINPTQIIKTLNHLTDLSSDWERHERPLRWIPYSKSNKKLKKGKNNWKEIT